MTQANDLSGRSVLVVEDDYYLAADATRVLKLAGADVVGPAARSPDALRLIETNLPDCAVVDINLGKGPAYDIAAALRASSVPFLFVTGYDARAIPDQFADVERLTKPVNPDRLIATLARLCPDRDAG